MIDAGSLGEDHELCWCIATLRNKTMAYGSDASLGWFVCYTVAMAGSSLAEQPSRFFKGTCNPQLFGDFPLGCRVSMCPSKDWHAYKVCVIFPLSSSPTSLQLTMRPHCNL
jgi:hypothetical protein